METLIYICDDFREQMTKRIFKEIRRLLYSNQELLKDKIPPESLRKLLHQYNNPTNTPIEPIMRRDLRYIKSMIEDEYDRSSSRIQ